MLGGHEQHAVGLEALELHDVVGQLHLATLVEPALDDRARGLLALLADVGKEGHDRVLYLGKEPVVEGPAGPVLKVVQPGVVGVGVGLARQGDLSSGGDDLVQEGGKVVPVAADLCPAPDVVGLGDQAREVRLELHGDAHVLGAVALEDLYLGGLADGEDVAQAGQAVQELARLGRGQKGLVLFLQDCHGLGAVVRGGRGVDGGSVARDARACVAVGIEVTLEIVQGVDVSLWVGNGGTGGLAGHAAGAAGPHVDDAGVVGGEDRVAGCRVSGWGKLLHGGGCGCGCGLGRRCRRGLGCCGGSWPCGCRGRLLRGYRCGVGVRRLLGLGLGLALGRRRGSAAARRCDPLSLCRGLVLGRAACVCFSGERRRLEFALHVLLPLSYASPARGRCHVFFDRRHMMRLRVVSGRLADESSRRSPTR